MGLLAARGLGLADAAPAIESAQAKLDRVLPDGLRRSSAAMRGTIALHTRVPVVAAEPKLVRVLSESAQTRHTAKLRYRSAEGQQSVRGFDVYGLIFRTGRWYVVGHCHLRDGLRTLRLDRVGDAEISERTFERPEGFDPVAYLTRSLATIPRAQAFEVILHTDIETARNQWDEGLGTLEPSGEGVVMKGSADELDWLARELIVAPFTFEVRSPDALTQMTLKLARALVERLSRGAASSRRAPARARPSRSRG
jgi:predicted DNA-binding transcriptional regulator YafY